MDALLPVFLAALLATIGDKPQLLAAALSARYRSDGAVLGAIALSALANAVAAGVGGMLVREAVPFRAVGLMVALALLFAGAGALWRTKPPTLEAYPRLRAFGASLFAFATLQFGDAVQFLTLAFAARTGSVSLTAAGACAAVTLACAPAVLLGADFPGRMKLRALRLGCGVALLLAGAWAAIDALRLV